MFRKTRLILVLLKLSFIGYIEHKIRIIYTFNHNNVMIEFSILRKYISQSLGLNQLYFVCPITVIK